MESNINNHFEERLRRDLTDYLVSHGAMDKHIPECPDVEELWPLIADSYIPDGIREFQNYPMASLGWMMFIGMAMAWYWDKDWESYMGRDDYYTALRDSRGYDNMDEAVVEGLLGYTGEKAERIMAQVGTCASRVYSMIMHEKIAPGSREAFEAYIAALHQLYLAGMAVELNALGYHMTKM